ncbi:hypothetical protein [Agrobacterium tumefaciens]|uniref:hypothetical protein n=1 Tax=Agrobacterium tumefaciens TaxID=358 RepID=UPI003BA0BFB7
MLLPFWLLKETAASTAPIDVSKLNTDQPYNVDVVEDHSLLIDRQGILGSKSDAAPLNYETFQSMYDETHVVSRRDTNP